MTSDSAMSKSKISGVYCIKNIHNNKMYIGSSVDIHTRWRVHKCRLRQGRHHSPHLQNSYNLDPTSFVFEVLEPVVDFSMLEAVEQQWIDIKKTYIPEFGYNGVRTVNKTDPNRMKERWSKSSERLAQSVRMKAVCSSPQYRQKQSESHKKYFADSNNRTAKMMCAPARKRVKCIQTQQIFESIADASRGLSVSVVKIRDSANNKRKSKGLSFEWVVNNE